ncbi:thermonuclease family protein [Photobacterium leiognathi]|uniref:thermonuclease family protein n=1 Tax=Photobacterium leiognathi TaxID=553611 RepID=UPI00298257DB|nr:thermonuclease family protein [Photobacterium leiognathi]
MKNVLYTFILLSSFNSFASDDEIFTATVLKIPEPDILNVDIPTFPDITGRDVYVRMLGVDAPSINGSCDEEKLLAMKALTYINSRLKKIPARIALTNMKRGNYFLYHAEVLVNGSSLGEELVIQGYARHVEQHEQGKRITRVDWCKAK